MVRKEMYAAIKAKLEQAVPEVKHVDLWNHNVEFIEQEDAWERPAVFVEFGSISWQPAKDGYRGSGQVRLHIVTDWAEGGQESAFDLCDDIFASLSDVEGETFSTPQLAETQTNHNHEDILESIEVFAFRCGR